MKIEPGKRKFLEAVSNEKNRLELILIVIKIEQLCNYVEKFLYLSYGLHENKTKKILNNKITRINQK